MSSKSLDKKIRESPFFNIEQRLKLKNLIIPFSKFPVSDSERGYIYYGFEKMPFKERHKAYQTIIKHEFAEEMRHFTKRKYSSFSIIEEI